ncbi:MAG: hypothetical protein LC792_02955 [Actinobacteria bacterium]|nr:hypothetical protein [Actinomycetota bacterium]
MPDEPSFFGPPREPRPLPVPEAATPGRPGRTQQPGVVLLAVGIVGLLAGGVFAALSVAGSQNTPDDAVHRLLDAAHNRDLLGALETLSPGERDAIRGPLGRLTSELKRLDILSKDADLGRVGGVELSFEGVKLADERLSDDITAVTVQGGTVKSRVDPAKLPLGQFVRSLAGSSLSGAAPVSNQESLAGSGSSKTPLVTVRKDGHWYVSLGYTAAESARRSAGRPVPAFGKGLAPAGASSAEAAVRAALDAATRVDVEKLIQLMPPGELGALQDYSSLFLDDVRTFADQARRQFKAQIDDLKLASRPSGDGTLVTISHIAFHGSSTDGSFAVAFDGSCATVTTRGGDQRFCQQDIDRLRDQMRQTPGAGALADLSRRHPVLGFVAVEEGGRWYLSPTRTLLDDITNVARVLQPKDLDDLKTFFSGLTGGRRSVRVPAGASPGAGPSHPGVGTRQLHDESVAGGIAVRPSDLPGGWGVVARRAVREPQLKDHPQCMSSVFEADEGALLTEYSLDHQPDNSESGHLQNSITVVESPELNARQFAEVDSPSYPLCQVPEIERFLRTVVPGQIQGTAFQRVSRPLPAKGQIYRFAVTYRRADGTMSTYYDDVVHLYTGRIKAYLDMRRGEEPFPADFEDPVIVKVAERMQAAAATERPPD